MAVLIIEPDKILARQYKRAFESAGLKARLCGDAQKAIRLIDKTPPAAVVIELQLARHSGIEFLHEFRTYEDWADIPIFIFSRIPEYALGSSEKTWASFGITRYFYKPRTSLVQLIGAVKEAIDK